MTSPSFKRLSLAGGASKDGAGAKEGEGEAEFDFDAYAAPIDRFRF